MKIYLQAVRQVAQYIVRAAAYDNTVPFCGSLADDRGFGFEYFVMGSFAGFGVYVHLTDQIVEKAVCHIFFSVADKLRCISG